MALQIESVADTDVAAQRLTTSYPFVTSLEVPPVDNALHWHSFDAEFVIIHGDLTLTDAQGVQHSAGPGSKVTVPARTLHKEYSSAGYNIVFGASVTPDQFGDPVDRPPATLD